jgi:RNA polymerase sigma-70 factor (ECF subfamily)
MKKQELQTEFIKRINEDKAIIYKVCNAYFDTKEDRQDIFQEIVYQMWKAYPNYKGLSKFSTWMYRIALNTAITFIRKKKNTSSDLEIYNESTYTHNDDTENIQLLYKAIKMLNKADRAIILLYLDDMTYREISATIGISEKNVSVKLVRIKRKLELVIKEMKVS